MARKKKQPASGEPYAEMESHHRGGHGGGHTHKGGKHQYPHTAGTKGGQPKGGGGKEHHYVHGPEGHHGAHHHAHHAGKMQHGGTHHGSHKGHKVEAHHAYHDDGFGERVDVSGHKHGQGNTRVYPEGHSEGMIRHADMGSLMDGHGHDDEHAHTSHHEANKAYGMHEGLSPEMYGSDDEGGSSHGGEGMADNAHYC